MNDLMREEFEAWAKDHEIYGDDGERFPMARLSGCYYENVQTQAAWEAWQASRESLVVELPPSISVTPIGGDGIQECLDCNGEYLHGHLVVAAIHAAGVKTK